MPLNTYHGTFELDEALFKEYFAAKDRPLNRRDGRASSLVTGIALIAGIWGTWLYGGVNAPAIVILGILTFIFAWSVFAWVTGATIFWPDFAWRKTYQRFFARAGATQGERPWHATFTAAATPTGAGMAPCANGTNTQVELLPYKTFDQLEVTEHLVILVCKHNVGSMLSNMLTTTYADNLAAREAAPDVIFVKDQLEGGTWEELATFLHGKLRLH